MSGLLIFGAGGHGKVVADTALAQGIWSEIAFADDRHPGLVECLGLEVVGTWVTALTLRSRYADAIVATGDNRGRVHLQRRLRDAGFCIATVVHPRATVSDHATLGRGSVIFAGAVIHAGTRIGEAAIVNTSAAIDHDCALGDGVHVSPGACLAGEVRVGECAWIGIGSCVIGGCNVGADAIVGAGASVITDVPAGCTAVGVPARSLTEKRKP